MELNVASAVCLLAEGCNKRVIPKDQVTRFQIGSCHSITYQCFVLKLHYIQYIVRTVDVIYCGSRHTLLSVCLELTI